MSALVVLAGLLFFIAGYMVYGRFMERVFFIKRDEPVPSRAKYDGKDYVPAKNWFILFGHHFSSIAGAGPIVGPILAVLYWGWLPAVIWIVLGAIFMGGVHDFGSLIVSVRNGGSTVADNASRYISKFSRLAFLIFVWFALVLVVAVFAHYAARSYEADPHIVIPSAGIIPAALVTGLLMYKFRVSMTVGTLIGLILVAITPFLGSAFPVDLSYDVWVAVLLGYSFLAAVLPVQYLLQPRDYLSSFLLFAGLGVLLLGTLFVPHGFHLPPVKAKFDLSIFPFLFVTIACGAISGFHSLINSGTTARQLPDIKYARRISYGAMLLEGLLALLVVVSVSVLPSGHDASNPIGTFAKGVGNAAPFARQWAPFFAVLVLNTFILTTLDTATRIARYITFELTGLKNRYISTLIVVATAWLILSSGQADNLWTVFGSANQLMAALALLVIASWLYKIGSKYIIALIPAIFMLAVTITALVLQIKSLIEKQIINIPAVVFALIMILLAVAMATDSLKQFWRKH
ncbi:MAG: carbon starvation protein A [Chlorobi bacterium]|nr:carbon starvation protein A [Chlorobiota bacterium]